ncbi:protein windbeutel [Drosophila hydei]|uniref:Protein windbeutel n=1 Tax=Drosophila hydei TaxID=7224 RepID=A0A6J1LR81_DROHY|nr:protein windbeutel [Drosophila hydei]
MMKLLLTLLLAALLARHTFAISCGGCVDLDEINFDKTIVRFPYALVKFDIAFPYGEKHEAFAGFSMAAHKVTGELLVATVGIKDYGEQENKALGERFKLNDKQFPGIILFKGNVDEFVQFPAHLDVTVDNLKSFVSSNTPLYIGCDGCLKLFNDALKNYANKANDEQLALIKDLQAKAKELSNKFEEQQNAKVYLVYMHKINELGYTFVEEETKRLLRLKAGKVTAAKKVELQQKLNILEAFRVHKLTKAGPEKAKAEL